MVEGGTLVQFTVWTMRERLVTSGRIGTQKNRQEVSRSALLTHLPPSKSFYNLPEKHHQLETENQHACGYVSDSKPSSGSLAVARWQCSLLPHCPEFSLSPLRLSLLFVTMEEFLASLCLVGVAK